MKPCPRCHLDMFDDDALNAVAFDGTHICTVCGQIETYDKFAPHLAEGLRVAQRRSQAAIYGLDANGDPKLPTKEESS